MKKFFCFFVCVLALLLLFGCKNTEYTVYEKINKRYLNMAPYRIEGNVTYFSNKTENVYPFLAYYNGNDMHMIHYTDDNLKVLLNNDGVFVKYDDREEIIKAADTVDGYMYVFPDSFFENYFTKETSTSKDKSEYIILETECNDKNVSMMKLWINQKNANLYKMEVYDKNLKLISMVEYNDFDFSFKPKDELFAF